MQTFEVSATRDEALRRLALFLPRAGREYTANRNFDRGDDRSNVSTLSPYVRCRLVTEEEVLRSVLGRFSLSSASKFVQEVFWRTYWKGWLEAHPAVWDDYRAALDARLAEVERDDELRAAYEAAQTGGTGIEAFDFWARELTATGYLHNHARMWFASIWIFTLLLPWELGADFFMRRLLCGDPAANTLSWRWVAGLHTRGKTYLARRANIRHYTEGRLDPGERLSRTAPALRGAAYPAGPLPALSEAPQVQGPVLLLLHDDDAGVETLALDAYEVRGSLGLSTVSGRSPLPLGDGPLTFAREALAGAVRGAPAGRGIVTSDDPDATATAIATHAGAAGSAIVLAPFAPVGPTRAAFEALRPRLKLRGISLVEMARRYDTIAWPHANRGYFGLREKIPSILSELGIAPSGA